MRVIHLVHGASWFVPWHEKTLWAGLHCHLRTPIHDQLFKPIRAAYEHATAMNCSRRHHAPLPKPTATFQCRHAYMPTCLHAYMHALVHTHHLPVRCVHRFLSLGPRKLLRRCGPSCWRSQRRVGPLVQQTAIPPAYQPGVRCPGRSCYPPA